MKQLKTIVIIGAGAAGMIAAWRAAGPDRRVLLLEKNAKPGIKILISGGGKCNITNGSDIRTMLTQFRKNESRFLKYSFHEFTNTQLLDLLRAEGVDTYTRDNGKVFPVSHNADDVVHALRRLAEKAGAECRYQSPVKAIFRNPDGTFNVQSNRDIIAAEKVIVATGGSSYQKTGTTGDGFRWMESFGHTIVPIRPALTPIYLSPAPPSVWQGTPIRDARLRAVADGAEIAGWNGDILITHLGLSGPATLEVSREAAVEFERGKTIEMVVDFFPEITAEAMEQKILSDIASSPSRTMLTYTEQQIPQRLAEYVLVLSGISAARRMNQLSKTERRTFLTLLKNCPLGTVKEIPLDRGEVTAGGVSLQEVDPTTMESTIVPNLFLCGEILDIAGPVGGYNLQAAFSTGYVAGTAAAS